MWSIHSCIKQIIIVWYKGRVQKKCVKLHNWLGGCFRSGTNYTHKKRPLKSILSNFRPTLVHPFLGGVGIIAATPHRWCHLPPASTTAPLTMVVAAVGYISSWWRWWVTAVDNGGLQVKKMAAVGGGSGSLWWRLSVPYELKSPKKQQILFIWGAFLWQPLHTIWSMCI